MKVRVAKYVVPVSLMSFIFNIPKFLEAKIDYFEVDKNITNATIFDNVTEQVFMYNKTSLLEYQLVGRKSVEGEAH